jgi:hypothetical protein
MLGLLRHLNHNFDAPVAARFVQLISVHDISEGESVRDEASNVDTAIGN